MANIYESVLPYCMGTTLNTYAHSFQEAQAKAMDSVASCILGTPKDGSDK